LVVKIGGSHIRWGALRGREENRTRMAGSFREMFVLHRDDDDDGMMRDVMRDAKDKRIKDDANID